MSTSARKLAAMVLGLAMGSCGDDSPETAEPPDLAVDSGSCIPTSCGELGADCGSVPDGCGGKITCGSCTGGLICGGAGPNGCGNEACNGKTCTELDASCGIVSDGCREALSECAAGQAYRDISSCPNCYYP